MTGLNTRNNTLNNSLNKNKDEEISKKNDEIINYNKNDKNKNKGFSCPSKISKNILPKNKNLKRVTTAITKIE